MTQLLVHPLLTQCGVTHGFGVRDVPEPEGVVRPRQVHGKGVAMLRADGALTAVEADAVISNIPGLRVGIATADCVPLLLAAPAGAWVAGVHAGWRGLARGVIPAALEALARVGQDLSSLRAVIGPCIRACCYEIDDPVVDALTPRFATILASALRSVRKGHYRLDLVALARYELKRVGVNPGLVGDFPDVCTFCDATRFHSYRREGAAAGRLVHFLMARAAEA